MNPKLRIACAGAGYFSQFHIGSWQRLEGAEIVGLCDHAPGRAAATGLPAFTDLTAMLAAAAPDLLDIILPPPAHAQAIRAALAAGLRWIVCQKPFCTSLDEARAVTQEAEEAGATLIVHENFRFQPWYRAIKTALGDGLLGQVQNATFRLRPGDGRGPDAYLDRQPYFQTMPRFLVQETAVHWVDTFRFLFGPPNAVYADLRRLNPAVAGEDAGHIVFDHDSGLRAVFDGNRHLDHAAENLRRTMGEALIEGTEGSLRLLGDGSLWHRRFGALGEIRLLPPDSWEGFGGDCVHALQAHVLAAWRDGAPPENRAADYLPVLETVEAIYASSAQGRKVALA
ncbi:Gfo/Idh/MocA family oxidoreductase [Aestuariicoccus sp. MJ-SS9]|uniref:Gfo/Idh/MocA family protein n=1 Tax=Aestuariicoccus sp. MJ-SS9 TaxID=3079855 RepID=UPI002914B29A|nr:Gfo/Idh/MocA family oxidoreductase [Aestuariicoccus sp. MJ-SS9]MDU8910311.1 Gfo/Idh/MocA family oxidoreductase [Aestuariicoccus sp. MJ-SS9]